MLLPRSDKGAVQGRAPSLPPAGLLALDGSAGGGSLVAIHNGCQLNIFGIFDPPPMSVPNTGSEIITSHGLRETG